ncbi:TolC family protein, partial [Pseudomonas sp. ATCC 13867]
DAQRSLFSAQQQLISDRLNQLTSEVNLYKALGGGWQATAAEASRSPAKRPKLIFTGWKRERRPSGRRFCSCG